MIKKKKPAAKRKTISGNVTGPGAPTKYKKEFAIQAYRLCLLGAIDKELADFFEVNEDTIHEWKKKFPEFSESIKKGKDSADAIVADKLHQRAIGYTHPDVDIKVVRGKIRITKLTKHYPPETAAAIFWLKNRQRDKWKDRHDLDIDYSKLSDAQLDYLFEKLKKSALHE